MLLREMFSPLGGPKVDDQSIDWADDLKFFIDNNSDLLSRHILPAVEKQKKYIDHPDSYKVYIKPLLACVEEYCKMFDVEDKDEIFTTECITEVARNFADQQKNFITNGDYDH